MHLKKWLFVAWSMSQMLTIELQFSGNVYKSSRPIIVQIGIFKDTHSGNPRRHKHTHKLFLSLIRAVPYWVSLFCSGTALDMTILLSSTASLRIRVGALTSASCLPKSVFMWPHRVTSWSPPAVAYCSFALYTPAASHSAQQNRLCVCVRNRETEIKSVCMCVYDCVYESHSNCSKARWTSTPPFQPISCVSDISQALKASVVCRWKELWVNRGHGPHCGDSGCS